MSDTCLRASATAMSKGDMEFGKYCGSWEICLLTSPLERGNQFSDHFHFLCLPALICSVYYLMLVFTSFNMKGLMLSKMKVPTELINPWNTEPRKPKFLKSISMFTNVRSISIFCACSFPSAPTVSLAIPWTFTPVNFTVKSPADRDNQEDRVYNPRISSDSILSATVTFEKYIFN